MTRMCVLIVDDIRENLLSLEYLLEDQDLDIVTAGSGQEALEKTLDHDFFLILMDVQMPGMNGYETAELLRGNRRTKDIPIIFITANNRDDEQLFKGYDAGAVDYLVKPIDPRILLGKIKVFKTLYSQQRELFRKTEELNATISELEELQQQLEEKNEQLKILSHRDGLTGLYNRRYFDTVFEEEWTRAVRTGQPLSLVMGDIDEFKLYNDTYGHLMGDKCLIQVAALLQGAIKRRIDRVARFGGEEFIALLPDTDGAGAEKIAATMLEAVRDARIEHKGSLKGDYLSISLGICTTVPCREESLRDFLSCVDRALYAAKEKGRDRFAVSVPTGEGLYCS